MPHVFVDSANHSVVNGSLHEVLVKSNIVFLRTLQYLISRYGKLCTASCANDLRYVGVVEDIYPDLTIGMLRIAILIIPGPERLNFVRTTGVATHLRFT